MIGLWPIMIWGHCLGASSQHVTREFTIYSTRSPCAAVLVDIGRNVGCSGILSPYIYIPDAHNVARSPWKPTSLRACLSVLSATEKLKQTYLDSPPTPSAVFSVCVIQHPDIGSGL